MNTLKKIFFLSSLLLLLTNSLYAEEHGEVSLINNQEVAWDKDSKTWLSMEAFWRNYASKSDGFIWKDDNSGLKKLLEFATDKAIPMVLETPLDGRDTEIKNICDMIKK